MDISRTSIIMHKILSNQIITKDLAQGAILNEEYHGFKEDYLVLHCLIRKAKPRTLFEVGTNMGTGTNIICNANPNMKVFSLDLPYELADVSLQSPVSEGKGMNTGRNCKREFTQVWGDSRVYDYAQHYPIEAWYIDGEHVYDNVCIETTAAIMSDPKIIIWHDTDMKEVMDAITHTFSGSTRGGKWDELARKASNYQLYRVEDTRISFAINKEVYIQWQGLQ
jgi:hypothetical protein